MTLRPPQNETRSNKVIAKEKNERGNFFVAVEGKIFPKSVLSQNRNVFIKFYTNIILLGKLYLRDSRYLLYNLVVMPLKAGFGSLSRRQTKKMQELCEC